jgi:GH25 family lysozyme M1 (1,4-beta-N-acetylmuramidase)
MIKGIDVSWNQGRMDWHKARMAGAEFCFIRCTDGAYDIDPRFEANWRDAQTEGFQRGPYFVIQSQYQGVVQADHFLRTMSTLGLNDLGELPAWADCERNKAKLSQASLCARGRACLLSVEQRTSRRPTIYTCPGLWDPFFGSPRWARWYRFAIANYTTDPYPLLPLCVSADMVDYWQHSADGNGLGHTYGAESDDIDLDWRLT